MLFGKDKSINKKIETMETKDKLKIYIVDDEIMYLGVFEQYLLNGGFKDITTFDNGDDCINNLQNKPDVIFLDYNMDNLTGYDVLKKIKRYDPNIHVIMISGQEEIKAVPLTIFKRVMKLKKKLSRYLKK